MLLYVGPGAGFAVSFSLFTLILVVFSIVLGPLLVPIAMLLQLLRLRRVRFRHGFRRVVVLGLDGLDPKLVRQLMGDGRLPHLSALAAGGHFGELSTVAPALTPAAWSSFMTGNDPSRHNIYDFITRDPQTYLPRLSSSDVREPRRAVSIGRLRIPLGRSRVRMLRRGIPFWMTLGRHGLQATILRVPITFPPEPFKGRLLSGMCLPDLLGTQGTSSYYATRGCAPVQAGADVQPLDFVGDRARSKIRGPRHPFLPRRQMTVPLVVTREPGGRLTIDAGSQRLRLAAGEYSGWVPLRFRAGLVAIEGQVQFYVKPCDDGIRLYMTPVQIQPERPAMAVSHPRLFSNYLAKRCGPFATLGLLEDTSALNDGVLDERGFLAQAWSAFDERRAMFFHALRAKVDDVTICVFDTPDRIQHMFWRYRENHHPALAQCNDRTYAAAIDEMLVKMDQLVGDTVAALRKDTLLLVISDHGFTSFRRNVDLNAWLHRNGYLHLIPGVSEPGDWLNEVDWDRTRAYAIGLTGIFVNLQGRESRGIVRRDGEFEDLLAELKGGLEGLRDSGDATGLNSDTGDGVQAIRRALITSRVYDGPYRFDGPDLIIGYEAGYRCSWDCAKGRVTGTIFTDNVRAWSGDHCVDPELVPGVLFANTALPAQQARLIDVAATVLDIFGLTPDAPMQGESLLKLHVPAKPEFMAPVPETANRS